VVLAYDCMTRWLVTGQWLFSPQANRRDCLPEVLQAIGAGLLWEPPSSSAPNTADGGSLAAGGRYERRPDGECRWGACAHTMSVGFTDLAHGRMAATATRKAREVVAAIGTGILPTSPAPIGGSATVPGPVERKKSVKSMYLADKCPTTVREAAEIGTCVLL